MPRNNRLTNFAKELIFRTQYIIIL